MKDEAVNQIIQAGIDRLDCVPIDGEVSEIHFTLYNEDYFIIGCGIADKFLAKYGTFEATRKVQEYEQDNFGEVTTDFGDSEKTANMLAYIVGEEVLGECKSIQEHWNEKVTQELLDNLREELESQL